MPDPKRQLSDGKLAALRLLHQALDDAEGAGQDKWQFAIRKAALLAADATVNDLRWLLSWRWIEHASEVSRPGAAARIFEKLPALALPNDACFVLTHLGRVFIEDNGPGPDDHRHLQQRLMPSALDDRRSPARDYRAAAQPKPSSPRRHGSRVAPHLAVGRAATQRLPATRLVPEWRIEEGELYFRDELALRRGRKAAKLVELLLTSFQAANWKSAIPNPFIDGASDPAQQIVEAVRRLNDSLLVNTLRFHAHYGGGIVSWDVRDN